MCEQQWDDDCEEDEDDDEEEEDDDDDDEEEEEEEGVDDGGVEQDDAERSSVSKNIEQMKPVHASVPKKIEKVKAMHVIDLDQLAPGTSVKKHSFGDVTISALRKQSADEELAAPGNAKWDILVSMQEMVDGTEMHHDEDMMSDRGRRYSKQVSMEQLERARRASVASDISMYSDDDDADWTHM